MTAPADRTAPPAVHAPGPPPGAGETSPRPSSPVAAGLISPPQHPRAPSVGGTAARGPDYLRAMVIPIYNADGQVISSTIVDPAIYPAISQFRWSTTERGYVFRMRWLPGGRQEKLKLHRVIMCCSPNDGLEIDHINRNPLDNRRTNLRFVTRLKNMQNRGQARPIWQPKRAKWRARFDHNKITYELGRFDTYEEAEQALNEARAKVIGA